MANSSFTVLNLGPNEYRNWLSYEGEYLVEAFQQEPDIQIRSWGRLREGYVKGLRLAEVIERCFGFAPGKFPDVVIVDSSLVNSDQTEDLSIFEDLKDIHGKTILIFKTSDPWRFVSRFREWQERFQPRIWLVHSFFYTQAALEITKGSSGHAFMFPYPFGRRYQQLGLERTYDLGMIGRCSNGSEPLTPKQMKRASHGWKKPKIYHEDALSKVRSRLAKKKYLSRYSDLVIHLNECLTSWNSPVIPKGQSFFHTPFRYVEAPACGAISLSPAGYPELHEYYCPPSSYLNCEGSLSRGWELIKKMREQPEEAEKIRSHAYRIVMGNHQAKNRVQFLLGLVSAIREGRDWKSIDVRDYYSVPLR